MKIERMTNVLKEPYAKEFLLGSRKGHMKWSGFIPDIHDEETVEMDERIKYLSGVR